MSLLDNHLPTSWISASAPHSSLSVTANKSHLDPCSSRHECSSMISSLARTEHGTGSNDYMSFNQFDVVQDFSDHHYAKTSPGKATKDWVKAIQSEWSLLQKNLPGQFICLLDIVAKKLFQVMFYQCFVSYFCRTAKNCSYGELKDTLWFLYNRRLRHFVDNSFPLVFSH